jgi:hypothetical protein
MRMPIVVVTLLIAGASVLAADDAAPARRAFRAERRPDGSYSLRPAPADPRSPFSVGSEEKPLGRELGDGLDAGEDEAGDSDSEE